jgi:hypothetical protein
MSNNKEANQKEFPARRRFLAGIGVLSAFAFIAAAVRIPGSRKRNIIGCVPEKKTKMVRMLAEDGSLVEIDANLIQTRGKKVSDTELQRWIKK